MLAGSDAMPLRKPVVVYLDNQDYSNMANERRHVNEPDLPALLEALRAFKESGQVKFVFSAVGVAEALPIKRSDVELSLRQIRLLKELCGDNALINYGRLLTAEVARLKNDHSAPVQALAGKFDWLPAGLERELCAPTNSKSVREEAIGLLQSQKANARTFSMALPATIRLIREARLKNRQERIAKGEFFYIQPRFHEVMLRAAVGEASAAEKTSAFLESWNDLEWVIGLYDRLPDLADWYRKIVREPNEMMATGMRKFVDVMDGQPMPHRWKAQGWRLLSDELLLRLVSSTEPHESATSQRMSAERIRNRCPGICAQADVTYSFVWSYIAGTAKKEIPNSAAADAMHAAYAPYVDVFRADRSMAPHVATAVQGIGTRVVGDRRALVGVIKEILLERHANDVASKIAP